MSILETILVALGVGLWLIIGGWALLGVWSSIALRRTEQRVAWARHNLAELHALIARRETDQARYQRMELDLHAAQTLHHGRAA